MADDAPLACNINAIAAEAQPRYRDLTNRLRASIMDRTELPFGYIYGLNNTSISLPELAGWVTFERLCCPFLSFLIEIDSSGGVHLTMRGPKGAKEILQEEFPDA